MVDAGLGLPTFITSQAAAPWTAIALSLAALYFWWRGFERERDFRKLEEGSRRLARKEPAPKRLSFASESATYIWQAIVHLSSRTRDAERARDTLKDVASLSRRITEVSDQVTTTADELLQLLMKHAGPDLVAAAVLLAPEESENFELEKLEGLPRERVEHALLMFFDTLRNPENRAQQAEWGYFVPEQGSVLDFSTFGVGLSLTVPLRDGDGICGGVWLGFKQGTSALGSERKAFIQAIAEQAAASFFAARRFEARRKESDSEKDFLLGVSHDLRAPGNSALYAIRDLLSGELGNLSTSQRGRLEIIEQALEEQLALLSDVLDFAKHQRGFLQPRKETFSLGEIFPRLIQLHAPIAESRSLSIDHEVIPDVLVDVDPKHTQRILSNFLSNAIKYTEQGSIRISFKRQADAVEILISDSGIGIPERERHTLFSPFTRMENSRRTQGVGLGLALSKALAELNAGYVFYVPNPEGGSTFGLGLPLALGEKPQAQEALRRILVIDDDPAVCRMNVRYLAEIASTVVTASSLAEARQALQDDTPDFIVADVFLGEETVETFLDELEAKHVAIPTLLLSGEASKDRLQTITEKFKLTAIEKPVTREQLLNAVAEELERHFASYAA